MKIISWNVNGLRAAYRNGLKEYLKKSQPDIICLQEIKALKNQLPPELQNPTNYFTVFNSAQKKGYSGTAIFSQKKPKSITTRIGLSPFDDQGRFIKAEFDNFTLINLYLPHGGRQKEKLKFKLISYQKLFDHLNNATGPVILAGDFNIAHTENDLARPKQNQKNIMFTPEERRRIDKIIELGFIDTFRKFHHSNGHYTWWPYMAKARARNLGWRIDYIFTSKSLEKKIKNAAILLDIFGSDHCPIGVDLTV